MQSLSQDLYQQINVLCEQGDELADEGQFNEALTRYKAAWKLLPEPKEQWEAATWILVAMADAHFLNGKYRAAVKDLTTALASIHAVDNPFIYLRLGQSRFELGEAAAALEALQTAYELGDEELWEGEDEKYLRFVAA
ncbi:tetratricopeptide repeat protein [Neisseria perflava]|uniref:tetratricopeptide repeat protein n=1 Tax=Neisseria perflava TaxID=33053 RepID=UPI00209F0CCA|nr:tetratricopeptide repeat protein [Neisseria perflava]MCP1659842.1 tetratricopeptide (TPR) repeat protein [Neisseria perflava]